MNSPGNRAGSPSPSLPPLRQPLSAGENALVALLVFLGITFSVAKALLWSGGVWNAEAYGYAIGGLLISSVTAYLIARREKNRKPVSFGLMFAGISLFLCLLELPQPRKDVNAEVADLMREASGSKAIDHRRASSGPHDKLLLGAAG